ncbi:hypothetical protein EN847_35120, partial [Mesorhizobium sp. M1C.F.Ca.ET.204.01.1.1]
MPRLVLLVAVVLALACGGAGAAKLDPATVNEAQFTVEEPMGFSPVLLKAEILLDRARFSPGLIEGR